MGEPDVPGAILRSWTHTVCFQVRWCQSPVAMRALRAEGSGAHVPPRLEAGPHAGVCTRAHGKACPCPRSSPSSRE